MKKIFVIGLLLMFLFSIAKAEKQSQVKLKIGSNEVSIKILNKTKTDFKSIELIVKDKDLPEGISLLNISQKHLNVSSNKKSNEGLVLQINVDSNVKEGIHKIPFLLKDKKGHTWKYNIAATIDKENVDKYSLFSNYPNPFNSETEFRYFLANENEQNTNLIIYDVLGKTIRTLVDLEQGSGEYSVVWDGKDNFGQYVTSGLYFYKLTSGPFTKIMKMTLLK